MTLQKLFGWFRSPQLWAPGDWQLHHNNTLAHASLLVLNFLAKRQITQVTQLPYSPDLVPCDYWLFPKLKSPLRGTRYQTINEIQEYTTGQLWWLGKLCEVTRCLLLRDWGIIVLCIMFLCTMYIGSFSVNVSLLHITWLATFWTDLV